MSRVLGLALLAASACSSPPFGEALVILDTDAPVPAFVGELRVDLYAPDGTWYESRDFTADTSATWPLSFGVYTDEPGDKTVRLRLRAYPEGGTRDYVGERFPQFGPFVSPVVADSLSSLCSAAPLVPSHTDFTGRCGPMQLTALDKCPYLTGGAIAMRVHIPSAGSYRFQIVRTNPDAAAGAAALSIRTDCADVKSEVACDVPMGAELLAPAEILTLDAGDYVVLGHSLSSNSTADLTLRWSLASEWGDSEDTATPPATSPPPVTPRLVVDGVDTTPTSEPQPNLAIDRLVDVDVAYGQERTVRVLLTSECLGSQADLAGGQSCVDGADRGPVVVAETHAGLSDVGPTKAGTWSATKATPCTGTPRAGTMASDGSPLFDDDVCVPGGAFTLGSSILIGGGELSAAPEQTVVVDPFYMDVYEVTVGRYRNALKSGFPDPDALSLLVENEGPLHFTGATTAATSSCTFSGDASGPAAGTESGREQMPLNCVSWDVARALCQFWGGDLPTHAQWEYAATAAGRPEKSLYSWGDADPSCDLAVWGRDGFTASSSYCGKSGLETVDAEPWHTNDMTPSGVSGLGGGVAEWALDSDRPYTDSCWWQTRLRGVGCTEAIAPLRSSRGASYVTPLSADGLLPAGVRGQPATYAFSFQGFRCVRSGP